VTRAKATTLEHCLFFFNIPGWNLVTKSNSILFYPAFSNPNSIAQAPFCRYSQVEMGGWEWTVFWIGLYEHPVPVRGNALTITN
jgi:hypothetical protein